MADFWWRNSRDSKALHRKVWDQLSKPKKEGGLGFKDIEAFNLALLGKQLWRMATTDNLMVKVFKGRYFVKSDPLTVKLGSNPSYAWKSIHAAQELIRRGARKTIGNGRNSLVWKDLWIDRKPAHPPAIPQ